MPVKNITITNDDGSTQTFIPENTAPPIPTPVPTPDVEPKWFSGNESPAQAFHVAEDGSDANDGLTAGSPLKTIAAALKKGAKAILLRNGDAFVHKDRFKMSGDGPEAMAYLGSYGDPNEPRPFLQAFEGIGLHLWYCKNLVVSGVEIADADVGVRAFRCNNIWIEDCYVHGNRENISFIEGARCKGVMLLGNVIADAFSTVEARSQGVYCGPVDDLTMDANVVIHNGWKAGQKMTSPEEGNHGLYGNEAMNDATRAVNNLVMDNCATGLMIRKGGTVLGNVFAFNPIHLVVTGDDAQVDGNLFWGDQRLAGDAVYKPLNGDRRGWGVFAATASASILNNYFWKVPEAIKVGKIERASANAAQVLVVENNVGEGPVTVEKARTNSRVALLLPGSPAVTPDWDAIRTGARALRRGAWNYNFTAQGILAKVMG